MPAIPSLDKIKKKWQMVATTRASEYEEGVQAPRRDWQEATLAAEANYNAGVQAAIQSKSFAKGVGKAGTAKWKKNAVAKGPARWTSGVQLAGDDYATGFAPYRDAIQNLSLPPRYPRRDPRNIARVEAIAQALANLKKQQG